MQLQHFDYTYRHSYYTHCYCSTVITPVTLDPLVLHHGYYTHHILVEIFIFGSSSEFGIRDGFTFESDSFELNLD